MASSKNFGFDQINNGRSDYDLISDKVVSAMETGNFARARLILAEHHETFPKEVRQVQSETLRDYGVML